MVKGETVSAMLLIIHTSHFIRSVSFSNMNYVDLMVTVLYRIQINDSCFIF